MMALPGVASISQAALGLAAASEQNEISAVQLVGCSGRSCSCCVGSSGQGCECTQLLLRPAGLLSPQDLRMEDLLFLCQCDCDDCSCNDSAALERVRVTGRAV